MKLLYGEDKFFIGAVKFFKELKDFGFIASNNCNMDVDEYNQDFYVNSNSFVESDAKVERRLVVFQIEKRGTRTRAVNVRKFSKSDKDIELALSYYGDHEEIKLNDYDTINIINNCGIPSSKFVPFIKNIIENNENRCKESTYRIFDSMVRRFKTKLDVSEKYIFDRDFEKETKECWEQLFNALKEDEKLEILKHYPSAVKYLNNSSLIKKWLSPTSLKDCNIKEIQEIKENLESVNKDILEIFIKKVEPVVVEKAKQRLKELSKKNNIREKDIERELSKYQQFTKKKLLKEKKECLQQVQYNNFKKQIGRYKSWKSPYVINDVLNAFRAIENKTDEYIKELEDVFEPEIRNYINKNEIEKAISLINIVYKAANKKPVKYANELYPIIKQNLLGYCNNYKANPKYNLGELYSKFSNLTEILDEENIKELEKEIIPLAKKCILEYSENNKNNIKEIDDNLFNVFDSISSFYDENETKQLKNEIISILKTTSCIEIISTITDGYYEKWLSPDEAFEISKEIISHWKIKDISKWITGKEYHTSYHENFYDKKSFLDMVCSRAFELIKNLKIYEPFEDSKENNNQLSRKEIISRNCEFIGKLRHYGKMLYCDSKNQEWDDYLEKREPDEWLILSENNLVYNIPENITKKYIDSISIKDFDSENSRWYSKPKLKNQAISSLIFKSSLTAFDFIAERLKNLELSANNIPMAVALIELLAYSKPDKECYEELKEWNILFKSKIQQFRQSIDDNPKLCVILYCIYFETKAPASILKEIFEFLPPYIQIRCVKHLFCQIAQGKFNKTAESLYNLLSKKNSRLCLPLEITFEYLKLREKDPTSTLTHNIMLKLLDGRIDHKEWLGITMLTTTCDGRSYIDRYEEPNHDLENKIYYNGFICEDKSTDRIKVFIPYKMIDKNQSPKNYNNKYYRYINEFIKINFLVDEYQFISSQNGSTYLFDKTCEIELLNMSRSFKMLYNSIIYKYPIVQGECELEKFCECRLSEKLDNRNNIPFYWCSNKPCLRKPVRYMTTYEWENYTILDFMRILNIPTEYVSKKGKHTKFGYYIILSAYLKSFAKFYDHLKCRKCGNLMKPVGVSNYASRAVNEYACTDEKCDMYGVTIYLNHCFNKSNCDATIDSRDSKQCPNGQYICPECDACCSTENFRLRLENLKKTGGVITPWLENFVKAGLGHWEKNEFYCYRCGTKKEFENGEYVCKHCKDEIKPTIYNLF